MNAAPRLRKLSLPLALATLWIAGSFGFVPGAQADLDAATPNAIVKLIAKHGSSFTETLESLPELQSYLAKSPSPEKALNQFLAKESSAEQAKWLALLSETLEIRSMIGRESARVPNGLYEVASLIPPLDKTAVAALREAGMPVNSKDPNEVASNMSSAQAAHLQSKLALKIAEASPSEKQRLIAKFKETAKAHRR
jgi:hypothetical protein